MTLHPVAPGTAIHLPSHSAASAKRAAGKKRSIPMEEQILHLRKSLRRTRIFALVMVLLLSITAAILVLEIAEIGAPVIGQNYTIDADQDSD